MARCGRGDFTFLVCFAGFITFSSGNSDIVFRRSNDRRCGLTGVAYEKLAGFSDVVGSLGIPGCCLVFFLDLKFWNLAARGCVGVIATDIGSTWCTVLFFLSGRGVPSVTPAVVELTVYSNRASERES